MTRRPARPCPVPGCPNLDCKVHRRVNRTDDQRASASKRGYDRRWRRLRLMYLRANPLCADCLQANRVVAAVHVDHIVPKRDGGLDEWDNLQSLCHSCHSRKTAEGK